MSKCDGVRFESCALPAADFGGARLVDVSFGGSDCAGVDFTHAECGQVDLRGARLEGLRGIASLRGATIAREQVVPIAIELALALGLTISDDEPPRPGQ
jgi:uncharacterized protein YjbI with pentapeptide repeats